MSNFGQINTEELAEFFLEQITTGIIQPGDLLTYPDGTEKPADLTIGCEIENYSAFFTVWRKKIDN